MKITQKQLLGLVSSLGLAGVEVVENEADSEFNQDDALSAVDNSRRKILEPLLRSELEDTARAAAEGRVLGGIRAMLARNTGLSHSKLKEFPEDKMEDAIKAAIAHKISSLEGDQQATSAKIDEILRSHTDALAAKDTEWAGKYNELNEKYMGRDMLDFVRGKLKDAPLPQKLDRDIAANDFLNHLRSKYHLSYKEAEKAFDLMDKANPALPALNEAKNAAIDLMAEAKGFFEPRALWATDMRGVNPADAMLGKGQQQPAGGHGAARNNARPVSAQAQREARLAGYEKQSGL